MSKFGLAMQAGKDGAQILQGIGGFASSIGGIVHNKKAREEGARQFDLHHGLSKEQWKYQKMMMEEQRERQRRIRNAMLGIGRTKK